MNPKSSVGRFPGINLIAVLSILSLLLFPAREIAAPYVALTVSETLQGEWWRLLSGHLLHLDQQHLFFNVLGLWVVYFLFYGYFTPLGLALLLSYLAVMVGAGVLFFTPEITHYAGISGILYGFFAWGAMADVRSGFFTGIVFLVAIIGKTSWDLWIALAERGEDGLAGVAVEIHFLAVIAALLLHFSALLVRKASPARKGEKRS